MERFKDIPKKNLLCDPGKKHSSIDFWKNIPKKPYADLEVQQNYRWKN